MNNMYRGFSTIGRVNKFRVTDMELIKRDLINHFSIRKGEKLMNPNFGTIIWNVIFDPLTEEVKSAVLNDINSVIRYDPRVIADRVLITPYDQGLQVQMDLRYVHSNQINTLLFQFDKTLKTVSLPQ